MTIEYVSLKLIYRFKWKFSFLSSQKYGILMQLLTWWNRAYQEVFWSKNLAYLAKLLFHPPNRGDVEVIEGAPKQRHPDSLKEKGWTNDTWKYEYTDMKTFNYQTISHKSSLGFLFFNCTYSFRFWRQCNLNSFERWINVNNIQKTPLKLFQSFSFSPNPWSAIVCAFQTNSMDCQWLAVPCSSIIELRNFVSMVLITKGKWSYIWLH